MIRNKMKSPQEKANELQKLQKQQNLQSIAKKYPNAKIVKAAPKSELEKTSLIVRSQRQPPRQQSKESLILPKGHIDTIYVIANKRRKTCPWCSENLRDMTLRRQDKNIPIMYCFKCKKYFATIKMKNKWAKLYECNNFSSATSLSIINSFSYNQSYISTAKISI